VRILVLGATGRTGAEILGQAAAAGHQVRALVRDPGRLPSLPSGAAEVVKGDATDPAAVARAAAGVDAVLVALGPGRDLKSDLASRSAQVLTKALAGSPVRVVVLSAFGVGDSLAMASRVQRLMYRTVMRDLFEDKARADAIWQDSGLDWTIVRPVTLTNGPVTGHFQAHEQQESRGFPRIARADVAQFMVAQADSAIWSRRTVVLGPPA
jgi:uncharacterized protein YbjT (DUF2867 family)